jgi:hypothetical protein
MFNLQREGINFKIILLFYPFNFIRIFDFITIPFIISELLIELDFKDKYLQYNVIWYKLFALNNSKIQRTQNTL